MPYRVEFRPSAERSLAKLPRDVLERVLDRAARLADNPRPHGVKKLQGQIDLYRVAVGSYRIVYAIDDPHQRVTITIVADRKESYRGL